MKKTVASFVRVPAHLVFDSKLPPAVLLTWIQLRAIAHEGEARSPISLGELSRLTGKSQATLYRHMALLKNASALRWRSKCKGSISLTFPETPPAAVGHPLKRRLHPGSASGSTAPSEIANPPSYFPSRILGYLSYDDDPITTARLCAHAGRIKKVGLDAH